MCVDFYARIKSSGASVGHGCGQGRGACKVADSKLSIVIKKTILMKHVADLGHCWQHLELSFKRCSIFSPVKFLLSLVS